MGRPPTSPSRRPTPAARTTTARSRCCPDDGSPGATPRVVVRSVIALRTVCPVHRPYQAGPRCPCPGEWARAPRDQRRLPPPPSPPPPIIVPGDPPPPP